MTQEEFDQLKAGDRVVVIENVERFADDEVTPIDWLFPGDEGTVIGIDDYGITTIAVVDFGENGEWDVCPDEIERSAAEGAAGEGE